MKFTMEVWDRWQAWVLRIKEDLQSVVDDHAVFDEFREMVNENGDWIDRNHGQVWVGFVARAYGSHIASGIRRHIKNSKDSVSLMRLMTQMKVAASSVTYEFFLERFPPGEGEVPWQADTFALLSVDGQTLCSARIATDIEKTGCLSQSVEKLVDHSIAHLDKRGYDGLVTFREMTQLVDHYNALTCKYLRFLTGKGHSSLEASIQDPWQSIFRVRMDRSERQR